MLTPLEGEPKALLESLSKKVISVFWIPVRSTFFDKEWLESTPHLWDPIPPLASLEKSKMDEAFTEIGERIDKAYFRS